MADDSQRPVSVLFVCLGNICRSPMAEGVFLHMTQGDKRISDVDSCGTGGYHAGDSPDPRTLSVLKDHGITQDFYRHAARKFDTSDFTKFDYIMAMDRDNQRYLDQARSRFAHKTDVEASKIGQVKLWGSYGGKGEEEVIDPYYGARNGFEVAYEQMVRFTNGFLGTLKS